MKFAIALVNAAAAVSVEWGYDYPHEHAEYGTEAVFNDVEVLYDEIEYSIGTKIKTETRSRQVPVTTEYTNTEVRYYEEAESRKTKE